MIDDDIVASKRGIRLRKLLPILYLFIHLPNTEECGKAWSVKL